MVTAAMVRDVTTMFIRIIRDMVKERDASMRMQAWMARA